MNEEPVSIVGSAVIEGKSPSKLGYRVGAGIGALVCLSILAVAALLKPHPDGVGTHKQLGMPGCGFYERTGYPCITCGMTTAFAHVVRAELGRAFAVQPAGALLALTCVITACLAALTAITGRGREVIAGLLNFACLHWAVVLMAVIAIMLASWLWMCLLTYMRLH